MTFFCYSHRNLAVLQEFKNRLPEGTKVIRICPFELPQAINATPQTDSQVNTGEKRVYIGVLSNRKVVKPEIGVSEPIGPTELMVLESDPSFQPLRSSIPTPLIPTVNETTVSNGNNAVVAQIVNPKYELIAKSENQSMFKVIQDEKTSCIVLYRQIPANGTLTSVHLDLKTGIGKFSESWPALIDGDITIIKEGSHELNFVVEELKKIQYSQYVVEYPKVVNGYCVIRISKVESKSFYMFK
jgi:hypothetical protein